MLALLLDRPGDPIVASAREAGLLINCTQSTVLRFLPPYIVERQHIAEALSLLKI
jgi:acetylornithine/succinyldiaminopimelate/putrescine aminotransferase